MQISNNLQHFIEKPILFLSVIGVTGFLVRLYLLPFQLPIILDGNSYFWYAIDTIVSGHFPTSECGWRCNFPNNGWPALLSIFFFLLNSDNFLDYMNLQRLLSVILSVLTIIPIYLLCTRFTEKKYALFASSLFVFDPKIILNSLLGNAEPFFILVVSVSFFLFLSNKDKSIYASFGILAVSVLIRYEGLLLIIPFSIIYFIRFKKTPRVVPKYFLALVIFILVLLPMIHTRIQDTGQDGLISHVVAGPKYYYSASQNDQSVTYNFISTGIINLIKFLGWVQIPTLIAFTPLGLIFLFRKFDQKNLALIMFIVILLIPAFYAYSRNFQEVKYLLILFPMFCVLASYATKTYLNKFKNREWVLIIFIICLFLASLIYINYKQTDYEYELEVSKVTQYVYGITKVVNYYTGGSYIDNARVVVTQDFPISRIDLPQKIPIIYLEGYNSLEEFIEKNRNHDLLYLVVDKGDHRTFFLDDVFTNEVQYPYLKKVFDSSEKGYKKYHVKIFKIDYELFDSTKNE